MTLIAGVLLTDGLKYVEEIRKSLMGGAYLFTFVGLIEGIFLASEDMKGQLFNLVKVAVITSLVVCFPTIIQEGDILLNQIHSGILQGEQDAFRTQIEADGTEPSWSDFPNRISYSLGRCLQKIGLLGYYIIYWAKDLSILLLISVSPLLISFLAFSYTRSIGINFLITSLTVILWNIGFAIVDTLLVILGNIVMPMMGAGITGTAVITAGPQFFSLCLIAAVLPMTFYCAVPIITAAIMRGSNIASAALGAYSLAHHGASLTSGAGTGLITGIRNFLNPANPSLESASSSISAGKSTGFSPYGSKELSSPFLNSVPFSETNNYPSQQKETNEINNPEIKSSSRNAKKEHAANKLSSKILAPASHKEDDSSSTFLGNASFHHNDASSVDAKTSINMAKEHLNPNNNSISPYME